MKEAGIVIEQGFVEGLKKGQMSIPRRGNSV